MRIAADKDGRATPTSDLAPGTWFWRVAAQGDSLPGPLWHFKVRRSVGRASRVRGIDINGDGFSDVVVASTVLFGAPGGRVASHLTPTFLVKPDEMRYRTERLLTPVGDINGDGFDDTTLDQQVFLDNTVISTPDQRVIWGGPAGIQPESSWLACPKGGCGRAAGDVNGDGYADLVTKDALQLGSPSQLTSLPTTLLSDKDQIRPAQDIDGDGFDDLFALSRHPDKLSVLLGGPQGLSLGSVASLTLPKYAYVVMEAADVNGDGVMDAVLLITDPAKDYHVTVSVRITGRGGDISSAEERRVTLTNDDYGPVEVAVADVDGDGFDDIVVSIFELPSGGYARLVRGGSKAMRLDLRRIRPWGTGDSNPQSTDILSIGDYNGDGRDDIVIVGEQFSGDVQFFALFQGTSAGLPTKPSARYMHCRRFDIDECISHKLN